MFVNTRRMAERMARHLSERLGEDAVTAHHGSLSKETRLDAETRLKTGQLQALVATASLELGIDIGHIDLVCQIGSPHRIATLLQRVGRSGHTVAGLPKGRLFPTRGTTWSSARRCCGRSVVASSTPSSSTMRRSTCWRSRSSPSRRAASVASRSCSTSSDGRGRTATLARSDFDAVVRMTADGFSTRRGRRAALVHRDEVNAYVARRGGARASSPSHQAARSRRSRTTASFSSPRKPSSARSTRISPSRAWPATSFSSATPRGGCCRSPRARCV